MKHGNTFVVYYISTTFDDKIKIKNGKLHKMELKLSGGENLSEVIRLLKYHATCSLPKKRVRVIVNPKGGDQRGISIYENTVKPMLEVAGIEWEMRATEYCQHAKLLAYETDFNIFDGILVLGGDGLVHEVINGLLSRKNWSITDSHPVGIIPAGTSNAAAQSFGLHDTILATFACIKGFRRKFDAVLYEQGAHRFYGHLAFMTGLCADIDIEGNSYRWLGHFRIYWSLLLKLIRMRSYNVSISYLDAAEIESAKTNDRSSVQPETRYRDYFSQSSPAIRKIEESRYYSVVATKHPYLDQDFFLSDKITMENTQDAIHMFLIRTDSKIKRWHFLKTMHSGHGPDLNDNEALTKYLRCRACLISFQKHENSILDVDGEEVAKTDIYMESLPDALCFFVLPYDL